MKLENAVLRRTEHGYMDERGTFVRLGTAPMTISSEDRNGRRCVKIASPEGVTFYEDESGAR